MSENTPAENGYTGPETGRYTTEEKLAAQVGSLTDAEKARAIEMGKEPTHRIDSASPGGHDLSEPQDPDTDPEPAPEPSTPEHTYA
jgi:hypothetical protein